MDMENILEGLFKWEHEVVIVDSMGEPVTFENPPESGEYEPVKVYQRIVGDAEVALARETALRASALKRTELRNPTNLDRILLIPEFDKLDTKDLISLILLSEIPVLRDQAKRDLRFPYPTEPGGDATLEQQEEFQNQTDTYFERRDEAVKDATDKLLQLRKTELENLSRKRLEGIYENVAIDNASREAMVTTFNDMMAYQATYDDPEYKRKSFSSFSAFRSANSSVKTQLIEAYLKLEIHGDKLKK